MTVTVVATVDGMEERPLTDDDLAALRCYIIAGEPVPAALAARLLTDRDLWVKRAFDAAGLTDA